MTAGAALEPTADMSLARALDGMAHRPWLASIEMFEATLIDAANSRELSLRDWHANQLEGSNRNVVAGLASFVARRLATRGAVVLPGAAAAWGDGVVAETLGHDPGAGGHCHRLDRGAAGRGLASTRLCRRTMRPRWPGCRWGCWTRWRWCR